ncbi:MAG: O-antigen ligase family protein [Candidatus Omnitrophota bacterium]|nr:O-antigen ligase family protein [Candidatus Omnitrophota bacterium]
MRIALFCLITLVAILWTFKKPTIGLFYFLILLFLRDGYLMERIPEIYTSWHIPMITGWLILVAWLCHVAQKQQKIRVPAEFIAMLLLGIVIYASRWHAAYPAIAVYMFDEFIRVAMLFFLMINVINNEDDLKQAAGVLVSVIFILVLYAYYRYKTEGFEYAVPSVYYVDRNFFAESIVAVLPLAFTFYEESISKWKKILFLGITGVMAGGIILTYSRGGLLAMVIVLAALFIKSRKKIMMIVTAILVLIIFLPHIGDKYTGRMGTIATYEEDPSAMIRIATWRSGINMLEKHTLLGVGAGNFNDLFIDYAPPEMKKYADYTMSIHNMFLQIFSETGLLGGGLFIFIIISSLLGLLRLRKDNNALESDKRMNLALPYALGVSLIGFCGAGFFLPGAYYGYQYIIVALLVVSKLIYTDRIKTLIAAKAVK